MNFNTSNIRKDLRDLTIVVATFERPKFILRQVKYLSNLNAQVIITDGSKIPLSSDLLSMIEKLPHIQYVHNERSYVERVSSIANEINTPFAMCLADDDLYLQTGLFSAIRKLEEDLSAVACMGQSLGLDRAFNRAYVFKYGANLRDYEVSGKSAEQRLSYGFSGYRSATPYALFRTDAFNKVWSAREHLTCLEAVEYENAIRTYIEGKLVTTESIFWLRSFETEPVPSIIDGSRATDFSTWFKGLEFSEERVFFEERLKSLFIDSGRMSELDSKEMYSYITSKILGKSHASLLDMTRRMRIRSNLSTKWGSLVPLRLLKNSYLWEGSIRPILEYASRDKISYTNNSPAETYTEINQVLEFCNKFHQSILSNN